MPGHPLNGISHKTTAGGIKPLVARLGRAKSEPTPKRSFLPPCTVIEPTHAKPRPKARNWVVALENTREKIGEIRKKANEGEILVVKRWLTNR